MTFWCSGDGNWRHRTSRDEFGFGEHAACGPAAHEIADANMNNRAPTYANMRAICDRDKTRGWYSSVDGQTFQHLCNDFIEFADWPQDDMVIHPFVGSGYSEQAIRTMLNGASGNISMIFQVGRASYVPLNEGYGLALGAKGFIYEHFFTIVGYNSVSDHVYIANPDREPHSLTPDWVPVSGLMRGLPQAVLVLLKGGAMATIPTGWHDNAATKTLTAPNGHTVTQAMRDFVLNNRWESDNQPLEEKAYSGVVAHQLFTRCKLYYTAQRGVYFGDVGAELLAAQSAPTTPIDYTGLRSAVNALVTQASVVDSDLKALGG